ncbi:lysophospholipid acyltransferase family protein [Anaeromicropila herbilytica]|uniref:1-acyl-sn-glycerol-3-phosphate acyltransferase n=1 Tax=Anaeromicropila herbilytica TaxID=2785025 RepID=A0A7R7EHI6_9FIRM|nr:lysophospholipid acyltransferase family protein [Anaeromicropila herbilytica]BCN28820.1 1-acyl-sn-glycerol-3-phosphate acyltransferase [Anaeromicropila herbilytica]
MRSLLVILFLIVYSIVSLPLYLIEFIIGKINPGLKVKSSQAIVVTAFRMILFLCGIKVTVKGKENIPKEEAALFVFNHRSYFDILIGYTTVGKLAGFVAKKEMEHIPCIARWMRYLHCLFLDRENAREGLKTILEGVNLLKNGHSIFIAPEGTRNHEKEMLPFKEGSLKMAEKSGAPIVPVAMSHTDELLELHMPWIKKGHVIVEYCKPVRVEDLSKEQKKYLGAHVQDILKDTLKKNEVNYQ